MIKEYEEKIEKEICETNPTAFVVPYGHFKWNGMPQGLKNVPSEFLNIMNDIFLSIYEILYV